MNPLSVQKCRYNVLNTQQTSDASLIWPLSSYTCNNTCFYCTYCKMYLLAVWFTTSLSVIYCTTFRLPQFHHELILTVHVVPRGRRLQARVHHTVRVIVRPTFNNTESIEVREVHERYKIILLSVFKTFNKYSWQF